MNNILSVISEIEQQENCFSLKDMAVNGNDLILIGYQPGKLIGSTLKQLLELVMDGKIENDRESLLTKASEILNEKD